MSEAWHPASFRDPSGFVFSKNGQILRQINSQYQQNYEQLTGSGLYKELVEKNLLISHTELQPETGAAPQAWLWLQPLQLDFISYPYEWCFSQLKEAALTTLQVQQCALKYNMTLKDSSAFNVMFHQGRSVFIDTLSFESYHAGTPWVAYRQFCEHFLAPLALMAKRHASLNSLLAQHIDGIPLQLATALLPRTSWLDPNLAIHLHLHCNFQKKYKDRSVSEYNQRGKRQEVKIADIVESLKVAVDSLCLPKDASQWSGYYAESSYSQESMNLKESAVDSMLKSIRPSSLIDFGANTGRFSQIAARQGSKVIALDKDPLCVELLYLETKRANCNLILPLVMDLCNPSPGIGWGNTERTRFIDRVRFDCGLALALIHHLHVTGHIPLPKIAELFAQTVRYLIVEFVPLEDPQTQRLIGSRQSNFPDYTADYFEQCFTRSFSIIEKVDLNNSQRMLYQMRSKAGQADIEVERNVACER